MRGRFSPVFLLLPFALGSVAALAEPPVIPSRTPVPENLADFPVPDPMPSPAPAPKAAPPAPPEKRRSPKPAAKPAHAESASNKQLPQLLREVEAKYTQAKTLQAEFKQVNEIASLKTKKTSSGVIMVKRPDKLRWETLKPDMNLLVSDGRHFWFYTPPFDPSEHGQVIERRSNEINSKLANALISGHFSVARDMKIQQESAAKFLLTPKPGSAGTVVRAEIEIHPIQRVIQKVTLEHKGGNRSEITLSQIELGKPIADEAFVFTPPPNTDKIEK